MCAKKRLRDEIAAKMALESQKRNAHKKPKECERYYFCCRCKGYHLTSETKEEYEMKRLVKKEPEPIKKGW